MGVMANILDLDFLHCPARRQENMFISDVVNKYLHCFDIIGHSLIPLVKSQGTARVTHASPSASFLVNRANN